MRSVDPIKRMTKQLAVARTARMGSEHTAALLWNENMKLRKLVRRPGSRCRTTS